MKLSRSLTQPISPLPTISFFTPHPSFRPRLRPLPPSRTTAYRLHSRVLCFNNNPLLKAKASKETSDGEAALEEVAAVEKNVYDEKLTVEKLKEEPLAFQFSEKLNIKLDPEDAYSITLYGSATVVALWLASALVGAVDSIPLKNREELAAQIQDLKQRLVGLNDELRDRISSGSNLDF